MILPPLVLFPFVLALAVYRLYRLPRLAWCGTLRLNPGRYFWLAMLTAVAYLGLLAYTIGLSVVVLRALVQAPLSLASLLSIAGFLAGYPVAYIAAEWVFHYGFKQAKAPR